MEKYDFENLINKASASLLAVAINFQERVNKYKESKEFKEACLKLSQTAKNYLTRSKK